MVDRRPEDPDRNEARDDERAIGAAGSEGLEAPRTPDALHALLTGSWRLSAPRSALLDGRSAPFDYLCHTFFEGRDAWDGRPTDASPDCVVWANRGGGKTFLGAVATALDLVFKPGIEVRLLGGSREQSRRMYAHLRALFAREALGPMVEGRVTEQRLRLKNGSTAEILAQSHTSVRGTRVQKLRCDEVELFDESVWEAAQLVTQSSTIETSMGPVRVRGAVEALSTMHVPYGLMHRLIGECHRDAELGRPARKIFRWGFVDVLERCGEAHACHADGVECALWSECGGRAKLDRSGGGGHLSIEDAIAMKRRVALSTWSAEMQCDRPSRSDAVLPEFDPERHVVGSLPFEATQARLLWLGGMDFGFRSPTVVLWACVDESGVLWVVDERVRSGVIVAEHARAISGSAWPTPAWLGVDPAGRQRSDQTGRSPIQVLRDAGLHVRDRRASVVDGLTMIRARLAPASGDPTLFIHRRCTRLIESLETYRYSSERSGPPTPRKDGPDHAVDALRYLVQNLDGGGTTRGGSYLA
ncbi:MAG: hypothetical protein AAGK04_05505 [Planctomycetota bacterium]